MLGKIDLVACVYLKRLILEDANMRDEMLHDQFASKALECKFSKEFKSNSNSIQILCQESLLFKTTSNPFKSLKLILHRIVHESS